MEWNGNLTYGFTHWKKRHKNILEIYSTSVTYKNLFTFAIIEWSLKKKFIGICPVCLKATWGLKPELALDFIIVFVVTASTLIRV